MGPVAARVPGGQVCRPHFHSALHPWISDPAKAAAAAAAAMVPHHGPASWCSPFAGKPQPSPPTAPSHSSPHLFSFPPTPPKDATPDPAAAEAPGYACDGDHKPGGMLTPLAASSACGKREGTFPASSPPYPHYVPHPGSELAGYHGFHAGPLQLAKAPLPPPAGYGQAAKPRTKGRSSAGKTTRVQATAARASTLTTNAPRLFLLSSSAHARPRCREHPERGHVGSQAAGPVRVAAVRGANCPCLSRPSTRQRRRTSGTAARRSHRGRGLTSRRSEVSAPPRPEPETDPGSGVPRRACGVALRPSSSLPSCGRSLPGRWEAPRSPLREWKRSTAILSPETSAKMVPSRFPPFPGGAPSRVSVLPPCSRLVPASSAVHSPRAPCAGFGPSHASEPSNDVHS